MFCTKCGTKIDDDSKFCNSCGKQIEKIQKSEVTRIIHESTGIGVKEANDLVENAPKVIDGIPKDKTDEAINELKAVGAVIEFQGQPVEIPDDCFLVVTDSVDKSKRIDDYEKKELRDILIQVSKTLQNNEKYEATLTAATNKVNLFENGINKINTQKGNSNHDIAKELLSAGHMGKYENSEEYKQFSPIATKQSIIGIIIIFLMTIGLPTIILWGENLSAIGWIFMIVILAVVGLVIGVVILGVFSKLYQMSTKYKTTAAALNDKLLKLLEEERPEIEKEAAEADRVLKSYKSIMKSLPVTLIPNEYKEIVILEAMAKYLNDMEASTWKECVAVYKEDKHRQEMIAQQEEFERRRFEEMENNNGVKCPKCNSSNLQYASETKTSGGGYGFGSGCCGTILLGPIGLLCGMCGRGVSSETKTYWVCKNCGNKFRA